MSTQSRSPDSQSPYIQDILSQPRILLDSVQRWDAAELTAACARIRAHGRIVLTGMGASYAALLPAWRLLVNAGFAAWLVDTADLLSLGPAFLTSQALVIVASQSGRSAEVVALMQSLTRASVIAITNEGTSPLALAAGQVLEIHAEKEHAVSTRSYVNTVALATSLACAVAACGTSTANGTSSLMGTSWSFTQDWARAADAMDAYLQHWRSRVDALKEEITASQHIFFLARGTSMAAALYGALINKEAAKQPVEAMNAAQFRHGPLELADERLATIILAGNDPGDRERNLRLARDIERYGGRSYWACSERAAPFRLLEIPAIQGPAVAALEILPLQLLSVALAEQKGLEPGAFRHLQKVTSVE